MRIKLSQSIGKYNTKSSSSAASVTEAQRARLSAIYAKDRTQMKDLFGIDFKSGADC